MIVKMDMSDGMSNHSDFSNDSDDSQESTTDIKIKMESGILLAPTMVSCSHFFAIKYVNFYRVFQHFSELISSENHRIKKKT